MPGLQQSIQNRGVIDQWARSCEAGNTPFSAASAVPAEVQYPRLLDSISFYNSTGATITFTLAYLPDGGSSTTFYAGSVLAGATHQVPVALPNLQTGDVMNVLASATGLKYLVNFRD